MRTLYLAGFGGSGPEHWQRRWFETDPSGVWVPHAAWESAEAGAWVADLDAAAARAAAEGPFTVVGHSLGCLLFTEWRRRVPAAPRPSAAWLVAPPDLDCAAARGLDIKGFRPGDGIATGCPTVLVASRNDPYAGFEYSRRCAAAWDAVFVDAGEQGHLNAESGLGDWDGARSRWKEFLKLKHLEQT